MPKGGLPGSPTALWAVSPGRPLPPASPPQTAAGETPYRPAVTNIGWREVLVLLTHFEKRELHTNAHFTSFVPQLVLNN